MKRQYTFIDLFAGIGGFHQAMHSVGMRCVFASEWDKNARISYEANYKDIAPNLFENDYKYFNEDITKQDPSEIPSFDVCCGGFPCQPFSIAGLRRGFEDTRGTLFFNIANIVKQKISIGRPPMVLFLENVKGLKTHMKGETLKTILATLDELGYAYSFEVLNAKYFGVPQNRERLFIIAWYKDLIKATMFKFPYGIDGDGRTQLTICGFNHHANAVDQFAIRLDRHGQHQIILWFDHGLIMVDPFHILIIQSDSFDPLG